jgi:hypothetical protein
MVKFKFAKFHCYQEIQSFQLILDVIDHIELASSKVGRYIK